MEVNQAMDAHEGCNIFGWLDLQRVAGNFRVSVHVDDFFALTRVRQLPLHGSAMCTLFPVQGAQGCVRSAKLYL